MFNNEEYSLDERVSMSLKRFAQIPFQPIHFCFQFDIENSKDMRNVDDLVSFIEGEGDECGNEPKRRKRKNRKRKIHPSCEREVTSFDCSAPTELVENNPSKKSENDSTGPISLLKENHKINRETDNKENLMNRRDDEKKRNFS